VDTFLKTSVSVISVGHSSRTHKILRSSFMLGAFSFRWPMAPIRSENLRVCAIALETSFFIRHNAFEDFSTRIKGLDLQNLAWLVESVSDD